MQWLIHIPTIHLEKDKALALGQEGTECLSTRHQEIRCSPALHYETKASSSLSRGSQNGWSTPSSSRIRQTICPFLMEPRAAGIGKWQFPMLKRLVLGLKAFCVINGSPTNLYELPQLSSLSETIGLLQPPHLMCYLNFQRISSVSSSRFSSSYSFDL